MINVKYDQPVGDVVLHKEGIFRSKKAFEEWKKKNPEVIILEKETYFKSK